MSLVKFIVCVYNQPSFIEYQFRLFKKFLKQPFDMCIVDDSTDKNTTLEIHKVCTRLSIEYLRAPPNTIRIPSVRHERALSYGLKHTNLNGYTYFGLLDSDLFLLNSLDLDKVFESKNLLCVKQFREHIEYVWVGLCVWKTSEIHLHNFDWKIIIDKGIQGDTGSSTYYYLRDNRDAIQSIDMVECRIAPPGAFDYRFNKFIIPVEKAFMYVPNEFSNFYKEDIVNSQKYNIRYWTDLFITDKTTFFHFRDISNWQNLNNAYCKAKISAFEKYITQIL